MKMIDATPMPIKKESGMDGADFWKYIEEHVKKGRSLNELQPELCRAGIIGSFFRHNSPLSFPYSSRSTCIASTTTTSNEDRKQKRLEQIQTHVKLCAIVWSATSSPQNQPDGSHHSAFVKAYVECLKKKSKCVKKRKKQKQDLLKEKTEEQLVLEDMVRIIESAAFQLGPKESVSQFLRDCIPRDCYRPIMSYLWDFFELQNPYGTQPKPAELPPLVIPKRNKRKRSEHKHNSTAIPPNRTEENQLFPDRVALTVPFRKHNPLTQRNRFVGSHFNSGLSNMDVLFRQVTVAKSKTMQPKQQISRNSTIRMVSPPTQCLIRKPVQDSTAAIVAGAFRSIKRQRMI